MGKGRFDTWKVDPWYRVVNNCVPDYCGIAMVANKDKEQVPKYADVVIEEINDDIMTGTRTQKVCLPVSPSNLRPVCRGIYVNKHIEYADKVGDGTLVFVFDSEAKMVDLVNHYEALLPCYARGLEVVDSYPTKLDTTADKSYKITQKLVIRRTSFNTIPVLQLYCSAKRLRYYGDNLREGDIITVFLRTNMEPVIPFPPQVAVQPFWILSYLPILPKQQFQVMTFDSDKVEYDKSAFLKYEDGGLVKNECARGLEKKVRSHLFTCESAIEEPLTVTITKSKGEVRTIVLPVNSRKFTRYPVISAPKSTFLFYSHNIDGFIFRCYDNLPVKIDKDVFMRVGYSSNLRGYCETKLRMNKEYPYLLIEKRDDSWLVKSF